MRTPAITRRSLLLGTAAGGAVAAFNVLSAPASRAVAKADPRRRLDDALRRMRTKRRRVLHGRRSLNGWEMEKVVDDQGSIYTRPVPGTPLEGVQLRMGDVELVLVHVIRRFHYDIKELRAGDVVGWRRPSDVRPAQAESNQASGTAVQIRPQYYPAGARGGMFPLQELVVRDVLGELDGVVRWGGDDHRPDESLFSIDVGPTDARLAEMAARLRAWQDVPAKGAGTAADVYSTSRRKAARAVEHRQAEPTAR